MIRITRRNIFAQYGLALFLLLGWQQTQSCEFTADNLGNYMFNDCFSHDEQPKVKMPNLRVSAAAIRVASGGGTGLDVWFEIINSGQADSDWNLSFPGFFNSNGEFNIKHTLYVVSENNSLNRHFDADLSQWVSYSQTSSRENKFLAGATKLFTLSSTGSPRFFLMDRNQTYKIGLSIIIDDPSRLSGTISEALHGEIIESHESDNYYSSECLVYGYDIADQSEILQIKHFHIDHDLNLPLVGRC